MNDKTRNDKIAVKDAEPVDDQPVLQGELDELKREMRSAKLTQWLQDNQKNLLAAVVALVLILLAGGMWLESDKSQRVAAATLYQQALNAQDADKKKTLMQSVSTEFASSTYAALALMEMARLDRPHAADHLNALIAHPKAMQEWIWQARLDLATLKIEQSDMAAANALLSKVMGSQYQQQRHYLMALASSDAAEKQKHLQQALDAASLDDALQQKIKSMLASQAS